MKTALSASTYWRELPVSVPVGEGVLDAVLDLAYDDGGRFVVVDYKTDALTSADEAVDATADYRLQAGAYALAIESALGRAVDGFTFLFLAVPGGPVAIDVADLSSAAIEAERLIAATFADVPR